MFLFVSSLKELKSVCVDDKLVLILSNSNCTASDTGLSLSDVLSTLSKPTVDLSIVNFTILFSIGCSTSFTATPSTLPNSSFILIWCKVSSSVLSSSVKLLSVCT